MKLTAFVLAIAFLPWMTVSASAQSMTATPSQYTTTPSQYTTTPSRYTTTPSQYTTTPPQYIAVQGTTTTTPPITIPTRLPTTIPQSPTTIPSSLPTLTQLPTTTTSLSSTTPTANQPQSALLESEMVDGVDIGEQRVEEEETTSTGQAEGLVASYAQRVLGLDEAETQQFVIDFTGVVTELGFETNEVSLRVGAKVVLYLSLKRVWGLPAFDAA